MPGHNQNPYLHKAIGGMFNAILVLLVIITCLIGYIIFYTKPLPEKPKQIIDRVGVASSPSITKDDYWHAPELGVMAQSIEEEKLFYGKELIKNTAYYFGPLGKVAPNSTNGMNCQNCHLDAGTKVFGNNYGSVKATYPKYRARSGSVENIYKRVNDCFERSLNGKAIDTTSAEMQAIVAYINWLGKDVPKGEKAKGSGLYDIPYLTRPANPVAGKVLYQTKCVSCHQTNGQGTLNAQKTGYTYPPLWGDKSYSSSAGLYRLTNLARYIKSNMPQGATYSAPQLTDEEAWDIAAYINMQPRPAKDISKDWPKIAEKPFDHPFGPYADGFSEQQHKLGPFKPIIDKIESRKKKNTK